MTRRVYICMINDAFMVYVGFFQKKMRDASCYRRVIVLYVEGCRLSVHGRINRPSSTALHDHTITSAETAVDVHHQIQYRNRTPDRDASKHEWKHSHVNAHSIRRYGYRVGRHVRDVGVSTCANVLGDFEQPTEWAGSHAHKRTLGKQNLWAGNGC